MAKRAVVLIGNPGSGKSTIINGLSGKKEAKSGMALDGLSVTKEAQRVDAGDIVYIDTPGLSEVGADGEANAVREIEKGLQTGMPTNIVAVLRGTHGRLVKEDLATALVVMQALGAVVPEVRGKVVFVVNFLPQRALDRGVFVQMISIIMRAAMEIGGAQSVLSIRNYPDMDSEDDAGFPPGALPYLPRYITPASAVFLPRDLRLQLGSTSFQDWMTLIEKWLIWINSKSLEIKNFLGKLGLLHMTESVDIGSVFQAFRDFVNDLDPNSPFALALNLA